MGISAIFPHATLVKLEGTVLMGPWCGVEAKPLDITVENSVFWSTITILNARTGEAQR